MSPALPPVNVIFLNESKLKSKEEIIEDHIDVARTCVTDDDYRAILSMVYEEAAMKIGRLILEKQIQKNVEILDGLSK